MIVQKVEQPGTSLVTERRKEKKSTTKRYMKPVPFVIFLYLYPYIMQPFSSV